MVRAYFVVYVVTCKVIVELKIEENKSWKESGLYLYF